MVAQRRAAAAGERHRHDHRAGDAAAGRGGESGPVRERSLGARFARRAHCTSTKLKLAYVGLAAVDTWLSGIAGKGAHRARFVTKPLLMPTLAASLVTNPQGRGLPAAHEHGGGPGRRLGR